MVVLVSDDDGLLLEVLEENLTKDALPLLGAGVETLLRNEAELITRVKELFFLLNYALGEGQSRGAAIRVALEVEFERRIEESQCLQFNLAIDVLTGIAVLVAIKLVDPFPAFTMVKPIHGTEGSNA